jgi:hypothetical protein
VQKARKIAAKRNKKQKRWQRNGKMSVRLAAKWKFGSETDLAAKRLYLYVIEFHLPSERSSEDRLCASSRML